ncbi:MAG: cytochrome P450 [Rhodospirillaceae bacterium]|nr:cytochrome P450 [Rhodospirillaceae bacterium]
MTETPPVDNWATDYDLFDDAYVKDPAPVWKELREKCPIAHTERWGGSWLPTKYEDMQAFVRMVPELSSRNPLVVSHPRDEQEFDPVLAEYGNSAPPITSDPPDHIPMRRMILPLFTPKAVEKHRVFVEALCHELIDGFIEKGTCDAALDYAVYIPAKTIAHIIGVDADRIDEFIGWVRGVLEQNVGNVDERNRYNRIIRQFFGELVTERKANPKDDLISNLLAQEINGSPVAKKAVVGMCNLMLVAGIDTTWSSIGSALLHFSTHPEHRRRMATEPDLLPSAMEEMLRVYSPVTMAREVTEEIQTGDVTFKPGDKVLLNFPAANRDPEVFENPDTVDLDREKNRHIAFGIGSHRCAGSNLARLEMETALRVWFERIPEFECANPAAVEWAGGQVRGPRHLPFTFPAKKVRG